MIMPRASMSSETVKKMKAAAARRPRGADGGGTTASLAVMSSGSARNGFGLDVSALVFGGSGMAAGR